MILYQTSILPEGKHKKASSSSECGWIVALHACIVPSLLRSDILLFF